MDHCCNVKMNEGLPRLVCPRIPPPLWSGPLLGLQMSDIFDEVSEDLRADKTRKLLQRYAGVLVGVALLVVAGVGGRAWWREHEARESARVADMYIAAMRTAGTDKPAALAGFAQVAADGPEGYRTLARLREASIKYDSGDRDGALAAWDQVAGDASADRLLRDLASLQWALHSIDSGDPATVAARLKPLASPDNAWHALAEEAQAMLALRTGDRDAARDTLKRLAQDVTAPDGVRGRANGLLARLGG